MARAGFFAQGVVWLALIAAGVIAIRRRKVHDHARLMLAMAAVASGAIWVRLATTIVTSWHLPFDPVYGCVAWAGWLVPLALVWLAPLRRLTAARPRARSSDVESLPRSMSGVNRALHSEFR